MNIIKEFMSVMMGVKVMRLITQLGLIAVVFMFTVCAAGQEQDPKSPYPRAAKITYRTVKVNLGGGMSHEVKKQEIDLEDYCEMLKYCPFDGLDEMPEPILLEMPVYPYYLEHKNVEGFAEVSFTVDESGHVESLRVTDASHIAFAKAAAEAVLLWHFKPMTRNGEPAKVAFRQRIPFVLK